MKQFPQEYSVLFWSFAEILNNCWKQQLKKQRSAPPRRDNILFIVGELVSTTKCFSVHTHKKSFLCEKMSWMNSISRENNQHNYQECPLITNTSFTSLFSIRLLSFKEWIFFSHCAVSLNAPSFKHNVVKSTSNKKRNINSDISKDAQHTLKFERKQHKKFIPKCTMENALSCCTAQSKRQRINTRKYHHFYSSDFPE